MADIKAGVVTHFFDKISVGVVDVLGPLSVGEKIKVKSGDNEFEQEVTSMQVEHESVNKVEKGQKIGMKFDQAVGEGAELFKES